MEVASGVCFQEVFRLVAHCVLRGRECRLLSRVNLLLMKRQL